MIWVVAISAGEPNLQGREAARGVLRRAAAQVAARVRVLVGRGGAPRQEAAPRLTPGPHRQVPASLRGTRGTPTTHRQTPFSTWANSLWTNHRRRQVEERVGLSATACR